MKKIIKLEFSELSVENAIKELEEISKNLNTNIHEEVIDKVAIEVQENANRNLMQSGLKFYGFTNITSSWEIDKYSFGKSTFIVLKNNDEFSPYVEFGTGRVGQMSQHKLARKSHYRYNRKTPSKNKGRWTFKIPNTDDFIYNFQGYVGKAFLYNATYDIQSNIYNQARIVQPILDKYIK